MAVPGYFEAVQNIYIAFYQRPADPAGLRYWAERLEAADGDATAIIDAFAASAEATALYGQIDEDTIASTIGKIYEALFARAVEPEGLAFYVAAFMDGTLTAGNLALAILNAAQEEDRTAIENKLTAANEFTQQVDGRELTDAAFGSGDDFAFDYAGEASILVARAALAGVTRDPATILDSEEVRKILQGTPSGDTDAGPSGRTITLTEATDLAKGTPFGDRIKGNEETLNAEDTIEGGGGTDTLKLTISAAGIFGVSDAAVSSVESVVIESKGNIGITDLSEGPLDSAFDISNWVGVRDVRVSATDEAAVSIVSAASNSVVVETLGGLAVVQDMTAKSIQVNAGGYAGVMAGDGVQVDLEVAEWLFTEPAEEEGVFLPMQGGYGVVQAGNNAVITIAANEDNVDSLLVALVQAKDHAAIDVSGFFAASVEAGDGADVIVTAGGYANIYVGEGSDIDLDFTDVTLPDSLESELEQDFGGYAQVEGESIGTLNISNAGLRGNAASELEGEFSAVSIGAREIGVIKLANVFNEHTAYGNKIQTLIADVDTYAAEVEIGTGDDAELDLILENSKIALWLNGGSEVPLRTLNLDVVSDSELDVSSLELTELTIKGTGSLDLSLGRLSVETVNEYPAIERVDASNFEGDLQLDLSYNAVAVTVHAGDRTNNIEATSFDDDITVGSGTNYVHGGYGADIVTLTKGEGADTLEFSSIWDSTKASMDIVYGFQAGLVETNDALDTVGGDILDFRGMLSNNVLYAGSADSTSAVESLFEVGVLNAVFDSTNEILYIDTNASGALDDTDFAIQLVGVTELSEANLIFNNLLG